MTTAYERVVQFNQKVLGIAQRSHGLQPLAEAQLSAHQMNEEIDEFVEGHKKNDLAECVDACVDNIVFTMGTLYKMGVTPDEFETIFEVVMAANMTKKIGVKAGREGYDAADAVKPDSFIAPEVIIKEILEG